MSTDKIREIMDRTTKMVQSGHLKDVMKIIQSEMDNVDPETLSLLVVLAKMMKEKGETDSAYKLYKILYDNTSKPDKLGTGHVDTISFLYGMSMTTNSVPEMFKLLSQAISECKEHGHMDLLKTYTEVREASLESLPESRRNLYQTLSQRQNKLNNHIEPMKKSDDLSVSTDEMIKMFGLQKYDVNVKSKSRHRSV